MEKIETGNGPRLDLRNPVPSTIRVDRVKKMRSYAANGVSHVWIVDPAARMLDVFRLESGKGLFLDTFMEDDSVRAEPFQELEIELGGSGNSYMHAARSHLWGSVAESCARPVPPNMMTT